MCHRLRVVIRKTRNDELSVLESCSNVGGRGVKIKDFLISK